MEVSDKHYILDRDHPYLRFMDLVCYESAPGRWRVKWRDFLMMKQDVDFASEERAHDFYQEIWSTAHMIDRSEIEDRRLSFEDAEACWLELA